MSKLKDQTVSGIIWTSMRTIISFLVGPLLLIIQTRYLTPGEFGILSIVNIFLSVISTIENFGFSTAIIQRDEVTKNERSSLFFFQIIFVFLIGFLLIITAPIISNIFNMPPLNSLLRLLSIVVFLNSPIILFNAFLEKDFHFKELSIIRILRQIILFLSTLLFLVNGFGLTGIILGQIAAVLVMVILVLIVSYKKNYLNINFHFNIAEIKPYIKFGVFVGGKQLITQVTHHIDELIIGYFLSSEVLGLYYFAKNLLSRLRTLITNAFSKVLLPLLSRVNNDLNRLTRTYNIISKYLGVIAFPVFVGIAFTADLFIPILFGDEWLASINFFVILSIAYIPEMLTANLATSLLYSVNKPNLVLYIDIVVNIIYVFLIFVVSWLGLGIYAVVSLYALYLIGKTTVTQYFTQLHLHSTFKEYLSLFKYTLISTFGMVIILLPTKNIVITSNNLIFELIISIIVGIMSYLLIYILVDRKTLREMLDLIF